MDKKTYQSLVCIACGLPIHMHRDECDRAISCETLFRRYLPRPTVVKAPEGPLVPRKQNRRPTNGAKPIAKKIKPKKRKV